MEEFIDDLRKLEHSNFRGSSSSGGNYPKTDDPSAATLVPLDPDVDQFIGFTNSSSFFNLNDHHLQLIQMASDTTRLHNNQSSFFSTPPPYDLQPPYDAVAHQSTSLSSSLRPGGFGMESSKSLSMVMKAGYVESSSFRASGSDDLNGSRKADRNNDNNNKTGSGSRKRKRNTKDGLGMGAEKPPAEQVIHVRAKRGQATDSHSLAERVRRERINEKLRVLQDLVPGCYKTMGMAVMLDVIINYVHSLQNQIDFLSMKLSAASLFYDFNSPEAEAIEALQKASSGEAFDIERMVKEGTIGGPLPHPHIQSSSWPIIN